MTAGSKRMILYGFYNKKFKAAHPSFDSMTDREKKKIVNALSDDKAEGFADHEIFEEERDQMTVQDYPVPVNRYFVWYESPHESIEPIYFFCMNQLAEWGFPKVYKITDLFTASEHSSFWGAATARLGLASDKVSQYMATIGQFIRKDLFQLVRDIRWIDERIKYHEDARKGLISAEITLKGIWTDLVDGVVQGQRVSPNIFQLATQLQFTTLPDWFFQIHPQKTEDIDDIINNMEGGTRVVKDLLRRKLEQYLVWRTENFKELKQRRLFELKYLRQNYNVIRMYVTWLKPYLKHIERLSGDVSKLSSADLIAAFEGSLVEIEVLAIKIPEGNSKYYTCMLETFNYRARPSMPYTAETPGYHRGPIHVGQARISWRAYSWTLDTIQNFIKMKEKEDLDLLKNIDSSIKQTLDAIGDDLEEYLKQAGEEFEPKEEETKTAHKSSIFEPFEAVGKGFKDMFGSFIPLSLKTEFQTKKPTKADLIAWDKEEKKAAKDAKKMLWSNYKIFKKAHKMLTW